MVSRHHESTYYHSTSPFFFAGDCPSLEGSAINIKLYYRHIPFAFEANFSLSPSSILSQIILSFGEDLKTEF